MKRNRAFTLIELLIVIGIIAVLTTILIPVITSSISDSYKTVCATKLGTIVDSYAKYNDETGGFPRHVTWAATADVDAAPTSGDVLDRATLGGNTMQTVWMLIDAGFVPAAAFKCPADDEHEPKTTQNRYGWDSWFQFSFGVQNPYDGDAATPVVENKACPDDTSKYKANWVFFADMNPGGPASADNGATTYYGGTRRQSNHADGCNVATRNGNVWFHDEETSSVVYGEEIYDDEGSVALDVWPDLVYDVIITPTDPITARHP